jgi:hypothetical protein
MIYDMKWYIWYKIYDMIYDIKQCWFFVLILCKDGFV